MNLDTDAMGRAADPYREKPGGAPQSPGTGSQIPPYRPPLNSADPKHRRDNRVAAAGPQTPGEIRPPDRLCEFAGTAEVEGLLQELCARAEDPLVARLPRQAGQKEARYQHLFSGAAPAGQEEAAAAVVHASPDRLAELEKRVEALEAFVKALQDSHAKPV